MLKPEWQLERDAEIGSRVANSSIVRVAFLKQKHNVRMH
jgi:hypothetical protein